MHRYLKTCSLNHKLLFNNTEIHKYFNDIVCPSMNLNYLVSNSFCSLISSSLYCAACMKSRFFAASFISLVVLSMLFILGATTSYKSDGDK